MGERDGLVREEPGLVGEELGLVGEDKILRATVGGGGSDILGLLCMARQVVGKDGEDEGDNIVGQV